MLKRTFSQVFFQSKQFKLNSYNFCSVVVELEEENFSTIQQYTQEENSQEEKTYIQQQFNQLIQEKNIWKTIEMPHFQFNQLDKQLLAKIGQHSIESAKNCSDFNCQYLINIFQFFLSARLDFSYQQLEDLIQLIEQTESSIDYNFIQQLYQIFNKLDVKNNSIHSIISEITLQKLPNFDTNEILQLQQIVRKQPDQNQLILGAISGKIGELISNCKNLDEFMSLFSDLKKAKFQFEEHSLSMIVLILKEHRDVLWQYDIVSILHILRMYKYRDEFLFDMIGDSARQQIPQIINLTGLLDIFLAMQCYDGLLFHLAGYQFIQQLPKMNINEVLDVMHVYSGIYHYEEQLFINIIDKLYEVIDAINLMQFVEILRYLSQFDEELCRDAIFTIVQHIFEIGIIKKNQMQIIKIAHSLALSRIWDREIWSQVQSELRKLNINQAQIENRLPKSFLFSLFYTQNIAEACGKNYIKLINTKGRKVIVPYLQQNSPMEIKPSFLQQDIYYSLVRLGYKQIEPEKSLDKSIQCIDIALSVSGVGVAFEVDGPYHFTRNPPYKPISKTICRDLMTAARGWRVVNLPFWLWKDLKSRDRRDQLLERLIQDALDGQYFAKLLQRSNF
eukprot:TRINITY_DN17075_c1_g1_i8.p1 TRINITY_DN17075_c1_g1~~TRINITY_DN17075_c1_g1_i8.p1  ORF type:complete len:617 (-),score=46.64 TRINITY_DN17075_c1_g1_i8:298-2148(-)